ncbi:ankyrin repeat domain-containing protein [Nannocystis radixulma]|uniref:Ankyrin repeat domain-containing protein n=1 Tax=Nannocystis radixulma TaxID=2995305 RepID=A0ABT5B002_9BACT|nr:ankyrin repeat domain-containing protein [Nannocystis radixulma]MDC0667419.1 hypothetical protein [Nannocystis radixulma]
MVADDFEPMPDEPLLEAVRAGSIEDVRRRLDATNDDIDARSREYEFTALELAIVLRRLDVARLLLDAGADPNAPSADDTDALAVAIREFGEEARPLIDLLLAKGARPTNEAVLAAAQIGDLRVVDQLLAALPPGAAQVYDVDAIEGALLAAAVRRGDSGLFERVRTHGDPLPERFLQWAFDAAAETGRSAMWDRLLLLGQPDRARAARAAAVGFLRDARPEQHALLRRIALEAGPAAAGQLFALAVMSDCPEREPLLALAIACNGDLESRHNDGMTPLLLAADRHDVAMMRRLIALGADRHARDDAGRGLSAYVERWPESMRLAEARAYVAALGVPVEAPAHGPAPGREPDPTFAALLVGLVLGVGIVAVVLLLHALGLL